MLNCDGPRLTLALPMRGTAKKAAAAPFASLTYRALLTLAHVVRGSLNCKLYIIPSSPHQFYEFEYMVWTIKLQFWWSLCYVMPLSLNACGLIIVHDWIERNDMIASSE